MNVTLLVPTKNRPDFLNRLLTYYKDVGFTGRICIADGSDPGYLEENRRVVAQIQGAIDIFHQELPGITVGSCLGRLLEWVDTPYVAFTADDDFLVPSGLQACAAFLDTHEDYSAAHGVGAMVSLQEAGASGRVAWAVPFRQPVIEEETASIRLRQHMNNYAVSLFSVHRVETWRQMFTDSELMPDPAFGELLPCCLSVISGKVIQLDHLYLVRQAHDQRFKTADLAQWSAHPRFQSWRQLFSRHVAEKMAEQDGTSEERAQELANQALMSYLANGLSQRQQGHNNDRSDDVRHHLRNVARATPGVQKAWRTIRSYLPGEGNRMSLQALLRSSSPYHADFIPVYRALTTAPDSVTDSPEDSQPKDKADV